LSGIRDKTRSGLEILLGGNPTVDEGWWSAVISEEWIRLFETFFVQKETF
jgi:hypothetical protein